jgi:hypothetical protein
MNSRATCPDQAATSPVFRLAIASSAEDAAAIALSWQSESDDGPLCSTAAGRENLLGELPESPFAALPRPGAEAPSPAPAALLEQRAA